VSDMSDITKQADALWRALQRQVGPRPDNSDTRSIDYAEKQKAERKPSGKNGIGTIEEQAGVLWRALQRELGPRPDNSDTRSIDYAEKQKAESKPSDSGDTGQEVVARFLNLIKSLGAPEMNSDMRSKLANPDDTPTRGVTAQRGPAQSPIDKLLSKKGHVNRGMR